MKRVLILRGLPGCGKSTYARSIASAVTVSADDFFVDDSGKYQRVDEKLGAAHTECLRKFLTALQNNAETVIVDNTNINPIDIAPYYAVALVYDYTPEVITFECPATIAGPRNLHGVPQEQVNRLEENLKRIKLPQRWNQRVVKAT